MTINGYLGNIAKQAIIRDAEKENIQRSISVLSQRLSVYFFGDLTDRFKFGSADRGTMLPRKMDSKSDVDYMIVFKDGSAQPQTYLDRLRRFAECKYARSEIKQAHPTIVLSLHHIHFELVPALRGFWNNSYKIPDKASSFTNWVTTKPGDLKNDLITANIDNNQLVKPLVRLLKYWNALNDYPLIFYELEKQIVDLYMPNPFMYSWFNYNTLEEFFYDSVKRITASLNASELKRGKVDRFKEKVRKIKRLKDSGQENDAIVMLKTLLPPLN